MSTTELVQSCASAEGISQRQPVIPFCFGDEFGGASIDSQIKVQAIEFLADYTTQTPVKPLAFIAALAKYSVAKMRRRKRFPARSRVDFISKRGRVPRKRWRIRAKEIISRKLVHSVVIDIEWR